MILRGTLGEFGDGNAEPKGLPYQITGTLNGLPLPWINLFR